MLCKRNAVLPNTVTLDTIIIVKIGSHSASRTSAYKITLTPAGRNSIPILEMRMLQTPSTDDGGMIFPQRSAVRISIPNKDGGKGTPKASMITVEIHCNNKRNAMPRSNDVGDIIILLLMYNKKQKRMYNIDTTCDKCQGKRVHNSRNLHKLHLTF